MQEQDSQVGLAHEAQAVLAALDDVIPFRAIYHKYGRIYPIGRGENRRAPVAGFGPKRYAASEANAETLLPWIDAPDRSGWALRSESSLLAIIDCEHPNKKRVPGPDGIVAFDEYCQALGIELPDHPVVRSGSGGIHHLFLFPAGLIPPGKYVGGPLLDGVDLLSFHRNVILPGSRIETWFGPGFYQAVSGFEDGISVMPHALAVAIIDRLGLREMRGGRRKKTESNRTPGRALAGPAMVTQISDIDGIRQEEVTAAVDALRRTPYFPRLWANEPSNPSLNSPRACDDTPSGMLFNIARAAIMFGYDKPLVTALATRWCSFHGRPFDKNQWDAIYCGALTKRGGGREVVIKVDNLPPISDGIYLDPTEMNGRPVRELPAPARPDETKFAEFFSVSKAALSFAKNRPDLDARHPEQPQVNDFRRTRSHLISINYYALKANCNEEEVLWFLLEFIGEHSPHFTLTSDRFYAIGSLANRRLQAVRARNNPDSVGRRRAQAKTERKQRSDCGSGMRLKRVARLIDKGYGYRRIAPKLGIKLSIARDLCRRVRKCGGTDRLLRPKTTAKRSWQMLRSFLAASLFHACGELRQPIQKASANKVIEEVNIYASKVGMTDAVTEDLLLLAVRRAKHLTKKSLVEFLFTEIANQDCGRNPIVLTLAQKFRLEGWLGSTHKVHGKGVPNRYGLAKSVLMSHTLLDMLRKQTRRKELFPDGYVEDGEVIWEFVKKHCTLSAAVRDIVQTERSKIGVTEHENPGSCDEWLAEDPVLADGPADLPWDLDDDY